ncbi:MAG: hypothetical protein E7633_10260 [Ruminococcaceae bacterium]|nr:hypothetical protein [Oscillospiraceae bacterium]
MKAKEFYLGIDLGTSSVKGILKNIDGITYKAKRTYAENTSEEWYKALRSLTKELSDKVSGNICAVCFSSQVGTYIVNRKDVISWQSSIGREELDYIKSLISEEEFIKEISMPHPDLISYPLPRFLYIQKSFGADCEVIMPKELLISELTGKTVTDIFSMRGTANLETGKYADNIIKKLGIKIKLPEIKNPCDIAGYVTKEASEIYSIKCGTPVYLGCNDFFAGLLGMGISSIGDAFDLSGTSEHIGYISENINTNSFVSGKYFIGNCTYGGTKSSGASCNFAIKNFGINDITLDSLRSSKPPIFLPYLCGERAPIFDENARGVYFGISADTESKQLAYSALEGVVFSLYDISLSMHAPAPKRLICGGGSAQDKLMNTLRATLFNCEVVSVCENDTSALGACMLGMIGEGVYKSYSDAVSSCVKYYPPIIPDTQYENILKERFEIYKELYKNLKNTFAKFNEIQT